MLSKCAEAVACRKGWPEDLSGIYAEEEMDRAKIIDGEVYDMTASESADQASVERRLEATNTKDVILIDWMDGKGLDAVRVGQLADRCFAFVREAGNSPAALAGFQDRNKHGLRQFYAQAPGDAHAVKDAIEKAIAAGLKAAEEEATEKEKTEPKLPLDDTGKDNGRDEG
jgi:hypothetical protein